MPLQNPRLGELTLNLTEYVNEGTVSRRYLLQHSKTNATLQLSIALTQIFGETTYNAPPLQKGEIQAGVAKLLQCGREPFISPSLSMVSAAATRTRGRLCFVQM